MRLIDADSLLNGIEELKRSPWYKDYRGIAYRREAVNVVRDICILKEPTVDAKPVVRGKWIDESVVTGTTSGTTSLIRQYRCSVCGSLFGRIDDMYCGKCGAKMKGENHETD